MARISYPRPHVGRGLASGGLRLRSSQPSRAAPADCNPIPASNHHLSPHSQSGARFRFRRAQAGQQSALPGSTGGLQRHPCKQPPSVTAEPPDDSLRPRPQSTPLLAPAPQPQTKRRGVRQPLCSIKQRRVGFSPRGASAAPVSKVRLTTFPLKPSPSPSTTSRFTPGPTRTTPCYLARHGGWVLPHRRTQPDRASSEQGSAWCLPAPASELMGQIAATRVSRGGLRAMLARRSKYPVLLPAAG